MANLVRLLSVNRSLTFQKNIRGLSQSLNRNYSDNRVPQHSQVVICGGGTIGTSIAYHLSLKGITDVVLLEQGSLSSGTSWHGAGLFGRYKTGFRGKMADYGAKLLKELDDNGHHTGLINNGSLLLSTNEERTKMLMYEKEKVRANDIEATWISPQEVAKLHPFANTEHIKGAIWVPGDCVANPTDMCQVFAKLAKEKGTKVIEDCHIISAETTNGRISSVTTSDGKISCEHFVLCGGMWSHHFGLKMNPPVVIPAHASQHFYLLTKPIEGTSAKLPTIRDFDASTYIREWSGGFLCGIFEPDSLPEFGDGVPSNLRYHLFDSNWEHFEPYIEGIVKIVPSVENAEVQQLLNGPESFSCDGHMIIGETPQIGNMYVATAMSSNGIVQASGVGRIISELIAKEETFVDCSKVDIKRFQKHQNTANYLLDRTTEIIKLPARSITKPNWFDVVKEEYAECIDQCGIVDMTSQYAYFKISVSGSSSFLYCG
ncbi:Pyruvate dehydrogenase phosphatase regulatory subunit, mitochondrial [Nymphon striatum]|nr:Pyruvate dehydrogenase phosphatase regulatory subunit, mitochondrial [Nymphon striatum]